MNQSAVLIFCLIILALSGTQGMPLSRTTRCMCIKRSDKPVNPRSLEKLEVIPRNPSCPQVEIIVTMKKGKKQKCLNPESKTTEHLLKALSKERSRRSTQTQRKA